MLDTKKRRIIAAAAGRHHRSRYIDYGYRNLYRTFLARSRFQRMTENRRSEALRSLEPYVHTVG